MRPCIPGRHRKREKVPIKIFQRGGVLAPAERRITQQLTSASDLSQSVPPAQIFHREIEQLERPIEGGTHEA